MPFPECSANSSDYFPIGRHRNNKSGGVEHIRVYAPGNSNNVFLGVAVIERHHEGRCVLRPMLKQIVDSI